MSIGYDESEPAFSVAEIAADDALLDALGGGADAPEDADDIGRLLAAWRADLDTDLPAADLPDDSTATGDDSETDNVVPFVARRRRWAVRIGAGVAAAVVA